MKFWTDGKKSSATRRKSKEWGGASADAPFVLYGLLALGVIVFILYPTIVILKESVYIEGKLSLEHYRAVLSTSRSLIKNSVFIGAWTTFFSTVIGLSCALYVTHSRLPGKKFLIAVLLMTLIAPPFMSSLSYIMLFGRRGLITWKLMGLSWNPYGPHGIITMESVGLASIAAFMIMAVLRGMDRTLEKASLDLGASRWDTLVSVTLPLASPGIVTAALIVFIRSLSDFGTPMFIGGNYNVLATQAYMSAVGACDLSEAAAMSTLLVIPALGVFVLYRRAMARNSALFSSRTSGYGEGAPLPKWVERGIIVVVWAFVVLEVAKYGAILCGAFVKTWGTDFTPTLRHMKALETAKAGSLLRSLRYSAMAATIAGIMGVALAGFIGRSRNFFAGAVDFAADLPFILPGPFFGISYLLAFNWMPEQVLSTGFLLVTNCVYRQLSIGIKSGISVLGQINPELENAVRDGGGGTAAVVRDVLVPPMIPAFMVGFVNTFTFTMTTIGGIIFLITPYTKVLTAEMFDAIQTGDIGASSAMASVIIAVTMAVNLSFSWLMLRGDRRRKKETGNGNVSSTTRDL